MSEFFVGALSALWLGILTSISPCPLATNIAAVSFIGRRIGRTRVVLLTGLLYTLGRILTYVILGILLVTSALSIPQVSHILQKYMNKILGPVLIFVGMILLELIRINISGSGLSEKMSEASRIIRNPWSRTPGNYLCSIFLSYFRSTFFR